MTSIAPAPLSGNDGYTCRDWALDLWDHGYQVVVAPIGGKWPRVPWKQWQTARVPREAVEEWYAQGRHNIAVLCGGFPSLVIVDADSAEAVQFVESVCAPTPMAVNTRRGRQFYFRHPGNGAWIKTEARVVDDPPVDIRGDGGLGIGPGSQHKTGRRYTLAEGCEITPTELPVFEVGWFPGLETAPERRLDQDRPAVRFIASTEREAIAQAQAYAAKVPGVPQGQRDTAAYILACRLVRGFDLPDDSALPILQAWNERCDPPLEPDEVAKKLGHARRYGTGEFGEMLRRNRRGDGPGEIAVFGWGGQR